MANNSGLSKRAALRQQQELEARAAKNRKIIMTGVGVLAVVVLVIVGIVVSQFIRGGGSTAGTTENQLRPPHATDADGISIEGETAPEGDVPHLIIYQDYQCPHCASMEQAYGPAVDELVDSGQITVETRTAYFMDRQQGDASKRASMAAAAADEVGMYREYHSAVFLNQQQGFSDEVLRDQIPEQIGMSGDDLTKFQEYYDTRAFSDFADAGNKAFDDSGWTGTPVYEVNGTELEFADPDTQEVLIQPTADDLLRAINELNG